MKLSNWLSLACLLAATACTTAPPGSLARPEPKPQAGAAVAKQAEPAAARAKDAASGAVDNRPQAAAAADLPVPDAVIKIDPGSDRLSRDMEARLAKIARQALADDRILLRLESFVPNGGSPALSLGFAEQSLQLVRKRLVDLNVNARRILMAPFGEEFRAERDKHKYWVEIFLVRPRL